MRKMNKSSKIWSTQSLHAMRIHLASVLMKEVLFSCGTNEREIPDMKKKIKIDGLDLT
jgi:hypothetical protein